MTAPKITSLPDLKKIEREAAHWFVRFDSGALSSEDHAAFVEWYHESQQHQDALERMSQFWGGLAVLQELKDHAANVDVVAAVRKDRNFLRTQTLKRVLVGALAASFIISIGFGATYLTGQENPNYTSAFSTDIGEQKTVDLPDGSQILLNTNSVIEVAYSKDERVIELKQGEAFFDVASNPKKPFSVKTVNGVVTAVGTAFSVKVQERDIDVLVTEGRVALAASGLGEVPVDGVEEAPATIEVSAGQSVIFAQKANRIDVVEPLALEKKVDWHDGILAFKGETLENVIADIGQYTDMQIEISDVDLRQQKVVAYYRIGDLDEMFEALHLMANVEVERVSDHHVRLYRAQ